MDAAAVWPVELEVRASRGGRKLRGSFPYRSPATISDRGTVRKEAFESGAFSFQLGRFERVQSELDAAVKAAFDAEVQAELRRQLAALNVDLLRGHSFDAPIASMLRGSLQIEDSRDALRFSADIPDPAPSWIEDTVRAVDAGLIRGVSPGFRIPPKNIVPDAERFVPEPGNPDVKIRTIRQAMLFELSLVTRPAYVGSDIAMRGDEAVFVSVFGKHEPAPKPGPVSDAWEMARWL